MYTENTINDAYRLALENAQKTKMADLFQFCC